MIDDKPANGLPVDVEKIRHQIVGSVGAVKGALHQLSANPGLAHSLLDLGLARLTGILEYLTKSRKSGCHEKGNLKTKFKALKKNFR